MTRSWIYSGIAEELHFRSHKLWQATGESRRVWGKLFLRAGVQREGSLARAQAASSLAWGEGKFLVAIIGWGMFPFSTNQEWGGNQSVSLLNFIFLMARARNPPFPILQFHFWMKASHSMGGYMMATWGRLNSSHSSEVKLGQWCRRPNIPPLSKHVRTLILERGNRLCSPAKGTL